MGILHKFLTYTDAARERTANWSTCRKTGVHTVSSIDTLTKKQCGALELKLVDAYKIIAQGVNDIINYETMGLKYKTKTENGNIFPAGSTVDNHWLGHKRKNAAPINDLNTHTPERRGKNQKTGINNKAPDNINERIAIASIELGKRLTCTVIERQMTFLGTTGK